MQQSPHEIKEKLLQALDREYNVVDMEAVFDVITTLETAVITKDALEKTRIGKYINELRKRTRNEHLAKRAKELVKSWRKLLPQTPQRLNGEDPNDIAISPGSMTVVGPGPGPGIGPGPGPGNKSYKSSVLASSRNKISSPSIFIERSSSPYFSSASNSPLLNSFYQGSNSQAMPTNYAPVKLVTSNMNSLADTVSKTLFNSNQSKNLPSSHVFKPVSPPPKVFMENSIETCILPWSSRSNSPGLKSHSCSSSPSTYANVSQNVSPTLPTFQVTHSSVSLSKTNAANKRLQKDTLHCLDFNDNSKIKISNGDVTESSGLNNVNMCDSSSAESETLPLTSLRNPKRKRSFDKDELQDNRLGEMIASLQSSAKLPKVKTTQQIIADLQAKKSLTSVSPDSLMSSDTIHSLSDIESNFVSLKTVSSRSGSNQEVDESSVSFIDHLSSQSVQDDSSVINTNFDITSSISYPDPIDEEIKKILSELPPLQLAEMNDEDNYQPVPQPSSVTEADLNRLHEHWEYVSGVYDCNGVWRPWQDCTEQNSYLGESYRILPYVNIE